ncbi:MAG: sporulation protein YqfD, partial [Lachnospiraceae bacterium]
MLINKLKYLQGYVKVRLCGYAPERFLNLCSNHNILIWNLEYQKEQYEFCISVRGMKHLKAILKKTRTKIVILERHGLPFLLHRYRKRKLFACGVLVCCGLLYAMSLFVWKVEINGNMHRTDSTVLKFLEQNQVYHGLLKSKVNCEAIEELLRAGYDDVIWASAKLEGTMLVIELQENLSTNEQAVTQSLEDGTPKDIVANKDTTIQSIFTRQGIPLVEQGTLVKEGDVLVEGKIPVMNDSGEVASYQYCVSDADIMGVTQYGYADKFPMIYEAKDFTGNQRKIYGVRLFQTQKNIPVFTK